jgi:GTP-binding protein YchF
MLVLALQHAQPRRTHSRVHDDPSMKIRVGILGLPNVGKSTLFNALARQSVAQAANYPFCTIEPNVAPIIVPDCALDPLGSLAKSERTAPATMEWVDIAGLAKGASRGEGLGNKFLATARECDAILHVVRTFEDVDTIHVDGQVDPVADAEAINLELILADLSHAERRLEKTTCSGEEREALEAVAATLRLGAPARSVGLSAAASRSIKAMGLLTLKPMIYAFNVDEADFLLSPMVELEARWAAAMRQIEHCDASIDRMAVVSARVEEGIASRGSEADQAAYLLEMGLDDAGQKEALLRGGMCYQVLPSAVRSLLGLSLVYTGPGVPPERSKTTRAHMFRAGRLTALGLAGRIHGEIERGFIKAEVIPASELLAHGSYAGAKEAGAIRTEGKDYDVQDGDVVLIKWNT